MKKFFAGLTMVTALYITGCGNSGDYVVEPVDEAEEQQMLDDYEAIMKQEMQGGGTPGTSGEAAADKAAEEAPAEK